MTVVSFDCDRCDRPVKGMFSELGTAGFYDVRVGGIWEDMRRGDETFVCDDCVLGSVEYAARSRRLVASHPDNGVEFVWRDGTLTGPQNEGYADAVKARALDALGYGEVREIPGPPAADRLPKPEPDGGNIHG